MLRLLHTIFASDFLSAPFSLFYPSVWTISGEVWRCDLIPFYILSGLGDIASVISLQHCVYCSPWFQTIIQDKSTYSWSTLRCVHSSTSVGIASVICAVLPTTCESTNSLYLLNGFRSRIRVHGVIIIMSTSLYLHAYIWYLSDNFLEI